MLKTTKRRYYVDKKAVLCGQKGGTNVDKKAVLWISQRSYPHLIWHLIKLSY